MTSEQLEKKMTEKEFNRMQDLNLNINTLLDALKESTKLSKQNENEEHTTINAYLNYLEEMKQ